MTKIVRVLTMVATLFAVLIVKATPEFTIDGGVLTAAELNGATTVSIPSSVSSIGDNVFMHLSSLRVVWIPYGVTSIGHNAFYGCTALTSVNIPDGVTTIGDWAFKDCKELTSILIPNSVTRIGGDAFTGCGFTYTGEYGYGGYGAFAGEYSGLSAVWTINHGELTDVELNGVTDAVIPDTVTRIRHDAFDDCYELKSIQIPSSVTEIESGAFNYCNSLSSVVGVPQCIFSDQHSLKDFFVTYALTNVVVASGVSAIVDDEFRGCYNLTHVTIPNSVTNISDEAFKDCWNFELRVFADDSNMVTWTIRSGELTDVDLKGMSKVEVPSAVWWIRSGAFDRCDELTDITIGNSVIDIDSGAFRGSHSLRNVIFTGTFVEVIGDDAFADCNVLTNATISGSICCLGSRAFQGCTKLKSVLIGSPSTKSGNCLFYNDTFADCRELSSVTLGNGWTTIGDRMFSGCRNLTNLDIPDSVTSIGNGAFQECEKLTDITVPDGVTCIEDWTFQGCSGLTNVTFGCGLESFGRYVFSHCRELTAITIPDSVMSIGGGAFQGCEKLTDVAIPDGVTSIEDRTFYGCSRMTNIVFGGNAPSCGDYAFDGVASGCTVAVYEGTTGWDEDGDGMWQGLKLVYREMSMTEIRAALAGSTDEKLAVCITNAANYNAYREWAESVKGTNGTKTAGAQAVKDSPNAWVSFALGSDKLLPEPPTDEDLTVEKFEPSSATGKFDFTVSVEGVEVGSEAQKENLKQVFGLEGAATLDPNDFSSGNVDLTFGTPENGKVKFTAGPKDTEAKTFFMKVKVNP